MKKMGMVIKKVLAGERKKGRIELGFVSEKEMKKLNRKYRKKDRPTDVLSFAMNEDGLIGDLLVCSKVVKKNARRYGVGYQDELVRVVIHGTLHLLGYLHGKKMRQKERIYAQAAG